MPRPTTMRTASVCMPTAKTLVISVMALLCLAGTGCRKRSNDRRSIPLETIDVILDLQRATATKAGATPDPDEIIKDLNIYLFHRAVDTMRRHYFVTVTNPLDMEPLMIKNVFVGDYDIYVLANNGCSTCSDHDDADKDDKCTYLLPADMANLYTTPLNPTDPLDINGLPQTGLMMTYKGVLEIRRADRDNPLEATFDFTRIMSALTLSVTRTEPNLSLGGAKIYSPKSVRPFNLHTPETDPSYFGQFTVARNKKLYIFANKQGNSTTSITKLQDRYGLYAPRLATYISYSASYDNGSLSYSIYPRNQDIETTEVLSNFDILPNTPYEMAVNFGTPDFTDPRLSRLKYETENCNQFHLPNDYFPIDKQFNVNTTVELDVKLTTSNLFNTVTEVTCKTTAASGNYVVELYDQSGAHLLKTIRSTDQSPYNEIIKTELFVTRLDPQMIYKVKIKYQQSERSTTNEVLAISIQTQQGPEFTDSQSGYSFN